MHAKLSGAKVIEVIFGKRLEHSPFPITSQHCLGRARLRGGELAPVTGITHTASGDTCGGLRFKFSYID